MSKSRYLGPSRAIGATLKGWREERGYTLRTVAKSSRSYPEKITFDYLSRVERGQLMPSVPKLATLAGVYGKPLMQLVDLYELEQLRRLVPRSSSYAALRKLSLESMDKGLLTKGLACSLGALDAARREGLDVHTVAIAYNNLGWAMNKTERHVLARQFLEEGLRIVERPETRIYLLNNLAIAHYHLDNLLVAEVISREACRLADENAEIRLQVLPTRCAVLVDLKRFDEAEPLLREGAARAREAADEGREIRSLYNLGYCLVAQGKADEGLDLLRSASSRAAELGNPDLRAKSLYYLGRSLYASGRAEEASSPFKSALLISQANDFRNEAFCSAFYLWQLARDRGASTEEAEYLAMATRSRERVDQRSEEAQTFDEWASRMRPAAPRRGRPSLAASGPGRPRLHS